MKKVVLIIAIVLLSFLCGLKLYTSSSSFQIDYSKLQTRNDYQNRIDIVPQSISKSMVLLRNSNFHGLPFDLSGEYHREEIDPGATEIETENGIPMKNINYMWKRNNSNGDTNLTIYFLNNYSCFIIFPSENMKQTYSFIYDNGKMELRDKYFNVDSYGCNFKYPNNKGAVVLNQSSGTYKPNNTQKNDAAGEQQQNWFHDFLNDAIIPWIWEIFAGGIGFIVVFIFIFNRTSQLLKKRYKHYLKEALFPEEHTWFGNNSPNDIYVSVKVYLNEGLKEFNLLNYFSAAISGKEAAVHAILGNAGEGKTFSISRVALGILNGFGFNKKSEKHIYKKVTNLIPIILNFSEISDSRSDDDIINYIYEKIHKVAKKKRGRLLTSTKGRVLRVITRYLSLGKFVIFIDGYDEIVNTETRLAFSNILMNFMSEYERCSFIITSRTQIYKEERFANILSQNTLYLSPLSNEQIREFLGKWSFPENKSGTELYQRIVNTVQLESVVKNPLLLTMIAHTYSNSNFSFLESRLNLYQQCCECLLKNWEDKKRMFKRLRRYTTLDNTELKMELLSLTAYHLYQNNSSNIKESKLLELWSDHCSEPVYYHGKSKDVLDDILNQSGLLEKTDDNHLRFRHRSFFEYFIARYMSKLEIDTLRLYNNVQNEQNILFFYLSMIDDELVVTKFMEDNLNYTKLIQDILIERKIKNASVVRKVTIDILKSTNYRDITQLQALGYIAQQYNEVESLIKKNLSDKLSTCESEQIKVNIIVGLMIFCDKDFLYNLLSVHLEEINLNYLVQYSGDMIDDLAKEIIGLIIDEKIKIHFIELLARTYRFEAIYNIYKYGVGTDKDLATIGMLYMSREPALLDWLESKKFYESASEECKKDSRHLQDKYGWIENEFTDSARENLFMLIHLSKNIIKDRLGLNIALIQNQIAFLLSYIISEEEDEVRSELINIKEFEVKSVVEFAYHWGRRKKKRRLFFHLNGLVNISVLNRIIIYTIIALLFLQLIMYLFEHTKILDLFYIGWEIRFEHMKDISILPFNSFYFVFLFGLFFISGIINIFQRKKDYSTDSILLTIMLSLLFSFIYELVVQNITFRLTTITTILLVCFLEIVKHRNNYPSFKEPQYSKIIKYLA
ncbi:MAG: hypothetical protein BGN88_08640 [Clostridiales bacterium 43-6]|nr:MAG: hypothetical protein BGN88_08640 [Clostridiales bacterium 43-6]